jgi:hypothetical protein
MFVVDVERRRGKVGHKLRRSYNHAKNSANDH